MKKPEFYAKVTALRRDTTEKPVSSNPKTAINKKMKEEADLRWANAECINKAKLQAEADNRVANSHYASLKALFDKYRFQDSLILNADETGSGLYEIVPQKVLKVKGQNHVQTEGPENWKSDKHVTTRDAVSISCNRPAIRKSFKDSGCNPPSLEEVGKRCGRKYTLEPRMLTIAALNDGVVDLTFEGRAISYSRKYGKPITGVKIRLVERVEQESADAAKEEKVRKQKLKAEEKIGKEEEKARKAEMRLMRTEDNQGQVYQEKESKRPAASASTVKPPKAKRKRQMEAVPTHPRASSQTVLTTSASGRSRRAPIWLDGFE